MLQSDSPIPFTEKLYYPFHFLRGRLLSKKFLDSEFTISISRKIFEKSIAGRLQLQNAYVEEYSKDSKFYLTFLFPEVKTHGFFVMMVKKQIRLIFYQKL